MIDGKGETRNRDRGIEMGRRDKEERPGEKTGIRETTRRENGKGDTWRRDGEKRRREGRRRGIETGEGR
jgi:hypothetical protein